MKRVVLYNPSITTFNVGDEIIFDGVYQNIYPLLQDSFVVNVSTHLPVSSVFTDILTDADLKFVCGTNLLRNMLERRFRQWDINIFNAKKLGPCVLVGVGWQQDRMPFTPYTKKLYKSILSKEFIHSVRDEYTKKKLQSIGFDNVINTGCPTMWGLTKEHCRNIPTAKANKVVFTLTDYRKDSISDTRIVDLLCRMYDEVYLWLQGMGDYEYAKSLGILERVKIVSPSLIAYDELLDNENIEYIGTRLHGGIRALQHGRRTMIIAVDGRAWEKKKDFNLPVILRNELSSTTLENIIVQERTTDIVIPTDNIQAWKKQFKL